MPKTYWTFMQRFESRIFYSPDGCWYWTGTIGRHGRAMILDDNGKKRYASRVSYEFYKGSPIGLCVCHTCDNCLCVNPDHLWLGTQAENMADMARKGRAAIKSGEKCPTSKLKNEDVLAIRSSAMTCKELAAFYNVTHSTVSAIRSLKSWKHL